MLEAQTFLSECQHMGANFLTLKTHDIIAFTISCFIVAAIASVIGVVALLSDSFIPFAALCLLCFRDRITSALLQSRKFANTIR